MNIKRFQQYLERRKSTQPITTDKQVKASKDEKIDADFPGYPHGHSKKEIINPENRNQQKIAALDVKDGEKQLKANSRKKRNKDEQDSDGSAGAFSKTEQVKE